MAVGNKAWESLEQIIVLDSALGKGEVGKQVRNGLKHFFEELGKEVPIHYYATIEEFVIGGLQEQHARDLDYKNVAGRVIAVVPLTHAPKSPGDGIIKAYAVMRQYGITAAVVGDVDGLPKFRKSEVQNQLESFIAEDNVEGRPKRLLQLYGYSELSPALFLSKVPDIFAVGSQKIFVCGCASEESGVTANMRDFLVEVVVPSSKGLDIYYTEQDMDAFCYSPDFEAFFAKKAGQLRGFDRMVIGTSSRDSSGKVVGLRHLADLVLMLKTYANTRAEIGIVADSAVYQAEVDRILSEMVLRSVKLRHYRTYNEAVAGLFADHAHTVAKYIAQSGHGLPDSRFIDFEIPGGLRDARMGKAPASDENGSSDDDPTIVRGMPLPPDVPEPVAGVTDVTHKVLSKREMTIDEIASGDLQKGFNPTPEQINAYAMLLSRYPKGEWDNLRGAVQTALPHVLELAKGADSYFSMLGILADVKTEIVPADQIGSLVGKYLPDLVKRQRDVSGDPAVASEMGELVVCCLKGYGTCGKDILANMAGLIDAQGETVTGDLIRIMSGLVKHDLKHAYDDTYMILTLVPHDAAEKERYFHDVLQRCSEGGNWSSAVDIANYVDEGYRKEKADAIAKAQRKADADAAEAARLAAESARAAEVKSSAVPPEPPTRLTDEDLELVGDVGADASPGDGRGISSDDLAADAAKDDGHDLGGNGKMVETDDEKNAGAGAETPAVPPEETAPVADAVPPVETGDAGALSDELREFDLGLPVAPVAQPIVPSPARRGFNWGLAAAIGGVAIAAGAGMYAVSYAVDSQLFNELYGRKVDEVEGCQDLPRAEADRLKGQYGVGMFDHEGNADAYNTHLERACHYLKIGGPSRGVGGYGLGTLESKIAEQERINTIVDERVAEALKNYHPGCPTPSQPAVPATTMPAPVQPAPVQPAPVQPAPAPAPTNTGGSGYVLHQRGSGHNGSHGGSHPVVHQHDTGSYTAPIITPSQMGEYSNGAI
jgi:hypothetical protein